MIQSLCEKYSAESVLDAIRFCNKNRLYSANYVKDTVEHRSKSQPKPAPLPLPVSNSKYHVTTEKRPLEVYVKAGGAK